VTTRALVEFLGERSFTDKDIPKTFYLLTGLRDDTVEGLEKRVFDGVSGIAADGRVEGSLAGRSVVIEFDGPETVKLNRLSRVMYENPEYWVQDDFKAAQRILMSHTPGSAAGKILSSAWKHALKRGLHKNIAVDARDTPEWLEVAHYSTKIKMPPVRNLARFAKYMARQAAAQYANADRKWRTSKYYEEGEPEPLWVSRFRVAASVSWREWATFVGLGTKELAHRYHVEGEWIVKNRKLHLPRNRSAKVSVQDLRVRVNRAAVKDYVPKEEEAFDAKIERIRAANHKVVLVPYGEWNVREQTARDREFERWMSPRESRDESEYVGDPKLGKALRRVGFRTMGQAKGAARIRRGQVRLDKLPLKMRKRLTDPRKKDLLHDQAIAEAATRDLLVRDLRGLKAERIAAPPGELSDVLVWGVLDPDVVIDHLSRRGWREVGKGLLGVGTNLEKVVGNQKAEVNVQGSGHKWDRFVRLTKPFKRVPPSERGWFYGYTTEAIAEANDGGDCYEAALNYMISHGVLGPAFLRAPGEEGDPDLILVHGEVTGQGPIAGLKYGHAWIENGAMVIDKSNGRDLRMPKMLYYALARIGRRSDHQNLHRYTAAEAKKQMAKHKTYGPWDLKTSSGV